MKIYCITQPNLIGAYWSELYYKGIKRQAAKQKIALERISSINDNIKVDDIVILNGVSLNWIIALYNDCFQKGIACVALAPMQEYDINSVSIDWYGGYKNLCTIANKTGEVAYVGYNRNSVNDKEKARAFLDCGGKKSDIFYNNGDFDRDFAYFFELVEKYNSVVITNDIVAVNFIKYMQAKHIDKKELKIFTLISTNIIKNYNDYIDSGLLLDCQEVGETVVKSLSFISKNKNVVVNIKTNSKIIGSDNIIKSPNVNKQEHLFDFYDNQNVKNVFLYDSLLNIMDEVDVGILEGIKNNKSYDEICEVLFISSSTLKYRLKQMQIASQINDNKNLAEFYFSFV